MKSKVAVFKTHDEALKAIRQLKAADFDMAHVSIIGKAEIIDDQMHVISNESSTNAPVMIGAVAGGVTGLLTGIGIFSIPGFGFLYGAGALIGVIGGLDLGIFGGGLLTILAKLGVKEEYAVTYKEHIEAGKFLVVVNAPLAEIQKAEHILHTEGEHLKL